MSKLSSWLLTSATRDLSPNSDKLPLFSVHQDLDGIKFNEICSRSLQLASGNGVSPGTFRFSGTNLVPTSSVHVCPGQNCFVQTQFREKKLRGIPAWPICFIFSIFLLSDGV